ncbi:hypothetical protein N8I74_02350 [Chitiniphilus purpureus]|uniref:Class I SAM-dependent methyltransferase n=1 Tax=Chitiniphilus purpureus TaxID=2981137 RepID=A0ABY6DQ93_9NEIS|nr:hypothetical protein [Chitiniphilus sp. CD1]UXY15878.1 hypothetical protein N8I74_02350 [Chitiniphilus sp. CD1]
MNSPEPHSAARLSAWEHELASLASGLRTRLETTSQRADQRVLWLGGGYSALLAQNTAALAGADVMLADVETRQLRRARSLVGERAQTIRLLDLGNLRRDVRGIESAMSATAIRDIESYLVLEEKLRNLFAGTPAVADGWAHSVVLDFAVNRIEPGMVPQLLAEAFRVQAREGVVYCAALVADEPIASAYAVRGAPPGPSLHVPTEGALLRSFEEAGFHGITVHWSTAVDPLAVDRIGDVDVRMCIIEAYRGKQGPCFELGQAVMYRGPWREVEDDDGHVYRRGQRVAVCAKTFDLMMRAPYQGQFVGLRSVNEPPLAQAELFDCNTPALRDPKVTKGLAPFAGATAASACDPAGGCC